MTSTVSMARRLFCPPRQQRLGRPRPGQSSDEPTRAPQAERPPPPSCVPATTDHPRARTALPQPAQGWGILASARRANPPAEPAHSRSWCPRGGLLAQTISERWTSPSRSEAISLSRSRTPSANGERSHPRNPRVVAEQATESFSNKLEIDGVALDHRFDVGPVLGAVERSLAIENSTPSDDGEGAQRRSTAG